MGKRKPNKIAEKNKTESSKKTLKKQQTKPTKTKQIEKKDIKKEVKKEKWFVELKKFLLEDEKNYSKEYKRYRNMVTIFAIICFFAVLLSTSFIDYSRAYVSKTMPYFVIRSKNEYKQATIYYGLFYKAYKCDNGDKAVKFGTYNLNIEDCKIVVSYDEDGYYTNPNGIKMTNKQINTIKTYYNYYNEFETEEELVEAYKISTAINKIWWVQKNEVLMMDGTTPVYTAIFNKLIEKEGEYLWELQYNDSQYYKCVKYENNIYQFSEYNAGKNTCDASWKPLKLNEEECVSAKTSSSFIKDLVRITNLCD